MKKILCFGDSNTYGYNPLNGYRYGSNERWTGILKKNLSEGFVVLEEGCNNRTAFCENPDGSEYTGTKSLKKYLSSDIDILILMIGINDLQKIYNVNLSDYNKGINELIKYAKSIKTNIEIILVSPSNINENILKSHFSLMFDKTSIEKSKKLSDIYKKIAQQNNCKFIDLNEFVRVCDTDGLHYSKEEHKKIAEVLINTI